ncbi:hypothetical protein J6590_084999 [Homalodisca vitripennis]|nr:hypothetical protein J6590_084999 [Homalodisca vitripennis]
MEVVFLSEDNHSLSEENNFEARYTYKQLRQCLGRTWATNMFSVYTTVTLTDAENTIRVHWAGVKRVSLMLKRFKKFDLNFFIVGSTLEEYDSSFQEYKLRQHQTSDAAPSGR